MTDSDLFDGAEYEKGLPKRVTERVQCYAMDEEGNRCDLPAVYETAYFGDEKLENAPWVAVKLCDYHGEKAGKIWEDNLPYRRWRDAKQKGMLRREESE